MVGAADKPIPSRELQSMLYTRIDYHNLIIQPLMLNKNITYTLKLEAHRPGSNVKGESRYTFKTNAPPEDGTLRQRDWASACNVPRGMGGGGDTPIYFLCRDVPTVRVSFSGSSVLNRVYNFTFSCLNRVVPVNLLLLSADFVRLRWNAQTYVSVLNRACLAHSWPGHESTALSLRQGSKIYIFCVLNRVRVSFSRPNPPTQIPVEYLPPPPPPPRCQTFYDVRICVCFKQTFDVFVGNAVEIIRPGYWLL